MSRRLFLLLALLVVPAPALGQSFGCAAATTGMERLICADRRLGALDAELGREVKKALSADPARRAERHAEARKWLGERDRLCALPAGDLAGEAKTRAVSCLATVYEARLAALKTAPAVSGDAGSAAMCRLIAERYRALLEKDPSAAFAESLYRRGAPEDGASPLEVLTGAAGSGVTIAAPLASQFSLRELSAWAKSRPRPFAFPGPLAKEFDDLEIAGSRLRLEQLPGENFYAASAVVGVAECEETVYFTVENGRVRHAEGPADPTDGTEASGCAVLRAFGTLDGAPVAFEESHVSSPSLTSIVTVTPWRAGGFGPVCSARFLFAPRFAAHVADETKDQCEGADCEALRAAALALVIEAQKHPLEARKAALARLSPSQAAQFAELEKQAKPAAEARSDPADPTSYVDDATLLRLPFVHGPQLYLVELGHLTSASQTYSDWRAMLKRLEKGTAEQRAVFTIGMSKGPLRDTTVK